MERSVLGRSVCKRSVFGTFGLWTRTLRPCEGSWAVRRELGRAKRIMSGFKAIVRRARVLEPSDEGECAWKVKRDCVYQRERSFMVYRPLKLFDLEIIELNRN